MICLPLKSPPHPHLQSFCNNTDTIHLYASQYVKKLHICQAHYAQLGNDTHRQA